jgi:predicted ATPase
MIRTIDVRNFKSLCEVSTNLERFTVFVGPNASGKTSILQALDLLCRLFRAENPGAYSSELSQGLRKGASGNQLELRAMLGDQWYRFKRPEGMPGNPSVIQVRPGKRRPPDGRDVQNPPGSGNWDQWDAPPSGPSPFPLSILLRLETSKLIQAGPQQGDPTLMASDGVGLHSALATMALNDPDSWSALQKNLRAIIPTIRRLRHSKPGGPAQTVSLLFDTVGADGLTAAQVSEGTLLILGLLTALYSPDRPSLVLLDDLDRALHPKAQKDLVYLLRGLLATNPQLQIVGTTHSPYLLDNLNPSEVRITVQQDDGTTVCGELVRHPKYPKWKDEMAPGEMWSLFGEKWLAEAKA